MCSYSVCQRGDHWWFLVAKNIIKVEREELVIGYVTPYLEQTVGIFV